MSNTPSPLPPDPHKETLVAIVDTARLIRTYVDKRARDHGTTRAQWALLGKLARAEGMTQAELAEMLEIQPISLTRLVDRLDEQGLVERRPHPTDRRANRLYITPKGRRAVADIAPLAKGITDELFAGIDPAALETVMAFLAAVKCNMKRADAGDRDEARAPEASAHVG